MTEPSNQKRLPEHEELGIVLVGSFNPAIFHPQWFLRQKLIGDDEAANAETISVSSEATDVKFGAMKLFCVQKNLAISISNIAYSEKLFDLVRSILRILPHTPLRACGINTFAHYKLESSQYWHTIGHTLVPKELVWDKLFESPGMQSVAIKAAFTGGRQGEYNVIVQPSVRCNPGLFVQVNTHYPVEKDENARDDLAEATVNFLEQSWEEATGQSRRVAGEIFARIPDDE